MSLRPAWLGLLAARLAGGRKRAALAAASHTQVAIRSPRALCAAGRVDPDASVASGQSQAPRLTSDVVRPAGRLSGRRSGATLPDVVARSSALFCARAGRSLSAALRNRVGVQENQAKFAAACSRVAQQEARAGRTGMVGNLACVRSDSRRDASDGGRYEGLSAALELCPADDRHHDSMDELASGRARGTTRTSSCSKDRVPLPAISSPTSTLSTSRYAREPDLSNKKCQSASLTGIGPEGGFF